MKFKKEMLVVFSALIIFLIPFASANIRITEVMYNHAVNENYAYIELNNNGLNSVDLTDWKTQAESGASWRDFGDLTIAAGEYIIIVEKLTGTNSYEIYYGNGDGVWNSADASYNAVDGNLNSGLNDNGGTASIKDGTGTIWNTFSYGSSYGANGDGNSLHLLGNGSTAAGAMTQGADSGLVYCGDESCNGAESCSSCSSDCGVCPYCGDGVCDADESCSSCSADCLTTGKVCCNNIAYTGNCCNTSNCGANQLCISNLCTTISYCGDGVCDANESCSNCSADCGCTATQCCSVGSVNANAKGCVDSGKITTTGNVCCSGTGYSGECCTDSECYSPNVCNTTIHTCISPYTLAACTATNCLCDLSLVLQSVNVFNAGSSQSYYVHVKDLNGNYTGTSTITNSIENSTEYITSYGLTNYTFSMNENKTMAYIPLARCGNTTNTIKVRIANFGCNDSASSNNEASKEITLAGSSCATTNTSTTTATTTPTTTPTEETTTEEVLYNIEVPQKIEIATQGAVETEKSFTLKVNVDNQKNEPREFEVWSYVYLDDICYSCYNGKTEDSNKKIISVEAGSSGEIDLENMLNISQPGNYKVKVLILESGSSIPKEFIYDLEVAGASGLETEQSVEEKKAEDTYELKSKRIKTIFFVLFMALIFGTAGFFGYKNKEKIIEFIKEKKKELERKRDWKEHIETRRGKGILQRLSKGFLKKSEDGRKQG